MAPVAGEDDARRTSLLSALRCGEALSVCYHLQPDDLASLFCVAKWCSCSHRAKLWCSYYVLRWGADGTGAKTQVRPLRSWIDDTPAPWPLVVGFCSPQSALDHLFWFVPVIRSTLLVKKQKHRPPPSPRLVWQVASRVRATPMGSERVCRCFVCDSLEVAPPGPEPQHFRRRWTRPCPGCARFAHRSCLERRLLALDVGDAETQAARIPELCCTQCGTPYQTSRRFPETVPELLAATLKEWRYVLRRLLLFAFFFVWLYTLAEHYCVQEGNIDKEVCILLAFTAPLMGVSVSQRFHRGIQMIWHTPNRWRYFQIFGFFAMLFYLVSLKAFQPQRWAELVREQPWLAWPHQAHYTIHTSVLGTFVLSCVSCLYLATASGVIFLFWKTSLRVPTVADTTVVECGPLQSDTGTVNCGLCQLGLCLDNTCM